MTESLEEFVARRMLEEYHQALRDHWDHWAQLIEGSLSGAAIGIGAGISAREIRVWRSTADLVRQAAAAGDVPLPPRDIRWSREASIDRATIIGDRLELEHLLTAASAADLMDWLAHQLTKALADHPDPRRPPCP